MSNIVSTTEAKARLNALLAVVEKGASITITHHGRPVAVLSPVNPAARKLGQFADVLAVSDDFDAPMDAGDLALWGE